MPVAPIIPPQMRTAPYERKRMKMPARDFIRLPFVFMRASLNYPIGLGDFLVVADRRRNEIRRATSPTLKYGKHRC